MNKKHWFTAVTLMCIFVLLSNAAAWKSPDDVKKKSREASVSDNPFKRGFRGMRAVSLDDFNDNKGRNYGWNKLFGSKMQIGDSVVHRFNRQLAKIGAEVRITQIQEDNLGNKHIRVRQYFDQTPVVGSDMIVHVNKNNEIYLVTGNLFNSFTRRPSNIISQESAIDIAKKSLSSDSVQIEGPASVVLFDSTIAYEIKVKTQNPQPEKWIIYIDAQTGSLLGKLDQLFRSAPGSSGSHVPVTGNRVTKEDGSLVTIQGWHDSLGNYFLYHKNAKWGIYNLRTSDWDQRSTASWGTSDPAVVSLGKNFEIIQNFVTTKLGRNSFNNLGGFAQANAHEGTNYVNAYWDGTDFHFGDGDNVEAGPLVTLDIAAHEFGHGITQYTSNLDYSYESGALNESFSDIMGTWVEFWAQPDGRSAYPHSTPSYADWLCGEDAWLQGDALRDLRDPLRFSQPSYYMGTNWYTGSSDNGGVHTNSGVQNKVYYLLAEGGSGTNDGHPYNLVGMGIDTAGQIAMYANMYLLTSTSQYRDSRNAWIQAAVTLGYNSNRVSDAWAAVGLMPLVKHLAVAPASISFDSVGIGVADTMVISLSNNGGDATLISSLSFSNPAFSAVTTLPFSVPGGGTLPLRIAFTPTSYGPVSGNLIINSNAADNPVITVPLSGSGVNPAVISITPQSFHQTVAVGDSTSATLTITNNGEAALNWAIAPNDNTITSITTPTYDANHFIPFSKGAADTRVGLPVTSFHGGPDRTGYTWIDSNEPGGPAYQWTDIKATGTMLSTVSGCDDCYQPQKISFKFPFYGNSFDTIYVSSNGFITFGTGSSQIANYPLPSTSAPANLIDALHDDLYPSSGGDIYFKDYGDRAVIQFDNVYPYSGSGVYTFQIVLERSGAIYLYYNNLTGPLNGATVGIQNGTRDDGLTVAYNTTYLKNSLAVKFSPKSKWLAASPLSGTVSAGQSASVRVSFNGAGISGGTYYGRLDISHNAPGTPSPQTIPCTLWVDGTRRLAVTPTTLNFGSHQVGIRDTSTLTLTNNGDEATVVSSVSSTNPYFTCITGLPITVTGYGNAAIRIVYQPGSLGNHSGTLTVNSNAEDNPVISVPVTGTGLAAPQINVSPSSIAVSLNAGDSTMQILKIRNPGGDTLSFSRVGVLPSWLSVSPVSGKIAAGDSTALSVIIRSSSKLAGTYFDSIQIGHNAPAQTNPQIVPVRMTVASVKRLSTQPTSISFGSLWVGRDSLVSLTLQNVGNDTTTISSITSNNAVFTQTGTVPIKVPPFGTRVIQVRYSPARTGADAGTLTINSDAGDNPSIAVTLTGSGVSGPQIVVSPNSLSRSLVIGDSTSATLTLTNNGGAALNWAIAPNDNTIASIAPPPPKYDTSHFVSLVKGSEDTRVGQPVTSFHGGPDRTGYTWIDSNEPGGPAYQWTDIKTTGTMLSTVSGCDDCYQLQKISFKFPFYGNSFDTIYVSSNGFLTFGTGSSQISNYPLPSTSAPANLIDALHRDLNPGSGGDIYFKDYGDRAVIQFDNVYPYSSSGVYTFQIVLEKSGNIYLYYNNLTGPLTTATVGIQNSNRDDGLTVAYNTTYLKNSLAVKFIPKSRWLAASPLSGIIPAGQSASVQVSFNGAVVNGGTYYGRLDISHNVPGVPSPQNVPCTLLVDGIKRLSITPSTLDFGRWWTGTRDTAVLTLTNRGDEATVVSSVSSTNPYFTCITGLPLTVPGFGNAAIRIVYQPGVVGIHTGTVTVNSNAEDNPSIGVFCTGSGIQPPHITIRPSSFSHTINGGDSLNSTLTIENNGGDSLTYRISLGSQTLSTQFEQKVTNFFMPQISNIYDSTTRKYVSVENCYGSLSNSGAMNDSLRVLWDISHGVYSSYQPSGYYSQLVQALAAKRIAVYTTSTSVTSINLSQYSAIVIALGSAWNSAYTPQEVAALQSYVSGGGGLIIMGDNYNCPNANINPVASAFGTTFGNNSTYLYNITSLQTHPVFAGIDTVYFGSGGNLLASTPSSIIGSGSGLGAITAANVGSGKVLTLGDINVWDNSDISSYDNRTFALNAFDWVIGTSSNWLSYSPAQGSVPPGSSGYVTLKFAAKGVPAGLHSASLLISHNVPDTSNPLMVPCTLSVNGFRSISVTPTAITFDPLWVGLHDTISLRLSNNGNEATTVSTVTSTSANFSTITPLPLTVPEFGSTILQVVYQPAGAGNHSGTLTVNSNAQDNPSISVTCSGSGLTPPSASIRPDSLYYNLLPSSSPDTQKCYVRNTGGDTLLYSIQGINQISSPGLAAGEQTQSLPSLRNDLIYSPENEKNPYVHGRLIIGMAPAFLSPTQSLLDRVGAVKTRELGIARNPKTGLQVNTQRRAFLITLSDTTSEGVLKAIDLLKNESSIAYAEPDYIVHALKVPNDPSFSQLYAMKNTGQTGGTVGADIDATDVWERHTGNRSILIGIIDTGIDYLHPDLAANIWTNPGEIPGNGIDDDHNGFVDDVHGWDFAYDDNDPMDGHYHGTHCSGTIAGVGNNGIGVAGVMWNANLVAIKFLDDGGSGTTSDAIDAVNYATAMGVKITSNSWGGGAFSQALMDAISLGGLFVAAAGNDGTDNDVSPHYPSSYTLDNVLAVAATDHNDQMASFSCYGRTSVDLGAPGVNIYSCAPGSSYQTLSGTSMATPHVSGAAGLIWSYNPSLTALQVKQLLMNNVDPIPSLAGKTVTGGRLNVNKALQAAGPAWLTAYPMTGGKVAPGDSAAISVIVTPSGIAAGRWEGQVVVATNDPQKQLVNIAASADIAAFRCLSASTSSLLFGKTWTGLKDTLQMTLTNNGNAPTAVSGFSISSMEFTPLIATPFTVPAKQSLQIRMVFAPLAAGTVSGSLTISSNAQDNPNINVSLSGICVDPPEIAVSPSRFDARLHQQDSLTRTMVISNSGGDSLTYNITIADSSINHSFNNSMFVRLANRTNVDLVRKTINIPQVQRNNNDQEIILKDQNTVPSYRSRSLGNGKNVLIFRDNLAWGYNVNVPLLTSMGATVSIAPSSEMDTINLIPYDLIVFESQQPTTFYTAYTANLSRFEQYLNRGGKIEFHCATYSAYRVAQLQFPGGMSTFSSAKLDATNYARDRAHPLLTGADSIMTGNYASLEGFQGVPASAKVIVANTSGDPTVVEYRYGSGLLLITGMVWEWGYANNQNCGIPLLSNALAYMLSAQARSPWLSLSSNGGSIPGDGQNLISILFNTTDIDTGTYYATIRILHNDPMHQSPVPIPVMLQVVGVGQGMRGEILSIGVSSATAVSGSRFRIVNLKIGSPVAGKTQGSRYRLIFK